MLQRQRCLAPFWVAMQPAAHPVQCRRASSQLTAWSEQAASKAVSSAHNLDLSARPLLPPQKPLPKVADLPQPSHCCCSLGGGPPQMHTLQQPSHHCCCLRGRLPQIPTCHASHTTAAAKAAPACRRMPSAAVMSLPPPQQLRPHALQGLRGALQPASCRASCDSVGGLDTLLPPYWRSATSPVAAREP